ncbi:MAG: Tfp pilus assembly protein FimT/FimU [Candidatus Hydrogenedentota bacterium]
MSRQKNQRGYTLVEVLVVVAIIALITGISAPAMVRFARMMGEDTREAAHEVQRLMRWAQVHSASNGVDTAVVYNINVVPDSMADDEPVRIIDGMGLMRRLRRDEFGETRQMLRNLYQPAADYPDEHEFIDSLRRGRLMVPLEVEDEEGYIFRQLPEGTCILPIYAYYVGEPSYVILDGYEVAGDPLGLHEPMVDRADRQFLRSHYPGMNQHEDEDEPFKLDGLNRRLNGYRSVQVLDLVNYDLEEIEQEFTQDGVAPPPIEDLFIQPRRDPIDDAYDLSYDGRPWSFPAHIFRPDGRIETSGGGRARLEVKVGAAPDRPFEDRFVEDPPVPMEFQQANLDYDSDDTHLLWETGHTLELFTTTGRVRLD